LFAQGVLLLSHPRTPLTPCLFHPRTPPFFAAKESSFSLHFLCKKSAIFIHKNSSSFLPCKNPSCLFYFLAIPAARKDGEGKAEEEEKRAKGDTSICRSIFLPVINCPFFLI